MNQSVNIQNLNRNDLDSFYKWASDPEVAKSMTWEAYKNKEDAYKFLVDVVEVHPYFKAITFHNEVVGAITLSLGKGNNDFKAELGYVLAKEFWGKGIATEAARKVIRAGLDDLNLKRIEAFVDTDNIASRKVLEKTGMSCEGLLKNYTNFKGRICDRYIYSITS